jgi:hypothetical protein
MKSPSIKHAPALCVTDRIMMRQRYWQTICLLSLMLAGSGTCAATRGPITAQLINAVSLADNCLYMLETTGKAHQPDCDLLFDWQTNHWPALEGELNGQRNRGELSDRDERSEQQYRQTRAQIDKWIEQQAGDASTATHVP